MKLIMFILIFLSVTSVWAGPDQVRTETGILPCRIIEDTGSLLVVETVSGDFVGLRKSNIKEVIKGDESDFYLLRGEHYEKKAADEQAVLEYLQVLQKNPQNIEANQRIESINLRHKQKRWEEGVLSARQLIAQQEYRKALEAFQAVLAENPNDDLAKQVVDEMCNTYTRIAFEYYDHCWDEGAIQELAKAEALNPESSEIYYVLGRIHQDQRQWELARQEYERALELNPNHQQARQQLLALIERQRTGRWFGI
ncbi:MAG TPA: tetratricopeptide repeat protein [bacterium]|nr:tetratricopeptide repeat protein [bacterium]HQP99195.1 tetratricopeptide repeat protein [bacterium]